MEIIINCFARFSLEVEPSDTIADLKVKIQTQNGIRPDHQCLQFGGKELEDGITLAEYGIKPKSRIDLIPTYPKIDNMDSVSEDLCHFIKFHSNCQAWLSESLIVAGNFMHEKQSLKEFCMKLLVDNAEIKRSNEEIKKINAEINKRYDEMKKSNAEINERYEEVKKSNAELKVTLEEHIRTCDAKYVSVKNNMENIINETVGSQLSKLKL